MQHKKSQHNESLRKSFENIIILKKTFNESLENLIQAKIHDKTVLNTKGTELTPKLSTDMVFPSRKVLFKAQSHQFLTQNTRKGFWQPRGIPGEGNRCEK
jgi:hypothetical protein